MMHRTRSSQPRLLPLLAAAALLTAGPALADEDVPAHHHPDPAAEVEATAEEIEADAEGAVESAKNRTKDAAITAKVKSKLIANPEINPFDIDVDTKNGVVTLAGEVEESIDMREAERLASQTEGVVRVDNQLRLESDVADEDGLYGEQDRRDRVATTGTYGSDLDARGYDADRLGEDEALPRTASPLPLLLLAGVGGLGAAAGLRRRRS